VRGKGRARFAAIGGRRHIGIAAAARSGYAAGVLTRKEAMSSKPIWQWSAVATARAIKLKKVSALEVVRAHVDRMRAVNPAVNAVVADLGGEAIRAARLADKAISRRQPVGPLHGVPITIKENVDVQGHPNPNGVPAFAGLMAMEDAPVVSNLRKAGAIVIGLTNTPEFSLRWCTDNPLHGLTLNPWDPAITCGGSSGGAAASVALGIGAIAHGNDIGGSLRWPAHCNGIATIRPTLGRVPAFNPSAPSERPLLAQLMSVQGPLAREVRDVRVALAAMSARDPRDPWWVPAPLKGPALRMPIRVALARLPPDMVADAAVLRLVRRAADLLSDAGYRVEEVEVPDLNEIWQLWADILLAEVEILQEQQMNAVASDAFKQVLRGFKSISNRLDLRGYMSAIANRSRHLRSWLLFLERWPIVLTPASVRPTPAPRADLEGDAPAGGLLRNDVRFISAINLLGLPAAVVPVGLHGGHPVGVQLVASRYREDLCLDAAQAIQTRVGVLAHRLWERVPADAGQSA
jgi:amidase